MNTEPIVSPLSPPNKRQNSSDNYYEDVTPRFARDSAIPAPLNASPSAANAVLSYNSTTPMSAHPALALSPTSANQNASTTPTSAHPGFGATPTSAHANNSYPIPRPESRNGGLSPLQPIEQSLDGTYEDPHAGNRSPAESDRSNFTSISQRGINPQWNPSLSPSGAPHGPRRPAPSAVASQRNELLLSSNPDFELPGAGAGKNRQPRGRKFSLGTPAHSPMGTVPRSAYEGAGYPEQN
jgi:hypothetical protein